MTSRSAQHDSPWVDLSQTYASHPSHRSSSASTWTTAPAGRSHRQVARQRPTARPGQLGRVKAQAADLLGLELVDTDVGNIPMIAADPYGNFIPGPPGLPQYVTTDRPGRGQHGHPGAGPGERAAHRHRLPERHRPQRRPSPPRRRPDADTDPPARQPATPPSPAGTLRQRVARPALHLRRRPVQREHRPDRDPPVFHSEHDRLIDDIRTCSPPTPRPTGVSGAWPSGSWRRGADGWNGERLFQAARFVTEMEYQHLVFEEFARKVQPAINPFDLFAFSPTDVNPAITAEFAHAVYRFGHSMLDETIPRTNVGRDAQRHRPARRIPEPGRRTTDGRQRRHGDVRSAAAGAIVMGLSDQVGQRARRVRHRDAAQQPARPAVGPARRST